MWLTTAIVQATASANAGSAEGKIVARELAEELGISEASVRRDLRDLAAAGQCQRVYGGAVPVSRALAEYRSRAGVEPESKRRIAVRAAQLIKPGDRVILDGGTTTLAVARALPSGLHAPMITHSPTIAALFLLGVTGVHAQHGLTTGDAEEAAMKHALARQAADTYVLASAEKIGAVSPYKVLDLDAITAILTDAQDDALDALRQTPPAVITCK